MLDKTLNGGGYTPTRGEGVLARQLLIASALRSLAAGRTKSASPTSSPQSWFFLQLTSAAQMR